MGLERDVQFVMCHELLGRRPLRSMLNLMGKNEGLERMFLLSSRNSKFCIDKMAKMWYNTHISSERATVRLK